MGSIPELVRDLRGFDRRAEVMRQLRKGIRKPADPVRRAIKARALATLPSRGGLNRWVASTRITVQIRASSRRASVDLRGGRNSKRKRSDIRAIDRGRVRHPSWGRRGPGQWHNQGVESQFFTEPAAGSAATSQWLDAIAAAVDDAFDTLRRG